MKIIIVGANGMLGHTLFLYLQKNHDVIGTVRSNSWHPKILEGFNATEPEKYHELIKTEKPDIVINCIGVIKQREESFNKLLSIEINSLFPHKLAQICNQNSSKLVHFSTDCVFDGKKGSSYTEEDIPTARDTYGLSKLMGEIDYPNSITIRTSIIGHELSNHKSLIDWFLTQENECKGFTKAIYSGFPTIAVARILENNVFTKLINNHANGIYQMATDPISKYDLLNIVAKIYNKDIKINKEKDFQTDKSLIATRFNKDFSYIPEDWEFLIKEMHESYINTRKIINL